MIIISILLLLAALLLSSALCITSAPASPPLPPFHPAGCPPNPLIFPCHIPPARRLAFPNPSDITYPLVNQSCLFLHTNLSSSSPFAIAFTDELLPDGPLPALAFTLFWSRHNPFMGISFDFSALDSCADAGSFLTTCDDPSIEIQNFTNPSCTEPTDRSSREEASTFNYSVSLAHNVSSAALLVQAEVNYGDGGQIKQGFILNSNTSLQPDPDNAYREQDDRIDLFVRYVAAVEATINISLSTTINDAPAPSIISSSDSPPPPQNLSKSTHTTVVLWIVVGVSTVALGIVVMILALAIKKRYRGRPPLVRSHLAGEHVAPPSTTTRAPFPHPHLESNTTPMMATFCTSPPYHTDTFQMSGTASWLKQPNPR